MANNDPKVSHLASIFAALGATDAELRSQSEVAEGIPQLATFLFLKLLAARIDAISTPDGVRDVVRGSGNSEVRDAYRRLAASGGALNDCRAVLHAALCRFADEVAYLLDDCAASRFRDWPFESTLENIHWGLFQTNERGGPVAAMAGLHEVIQEHLVPAADSGESIPNSGPMD